MTEVGKVFATFEIKGLQEAQSLLKTIAAQLDAINGKRLNLGGDFTKLLQQERQSFEQNERAKAKLAADVREQRIRDESTGIKRVEQIEKAHTQAIAEENRRKQKLLSDLREQRVRDETRAAKQVEMVEKAHSQALIEDARRSAQAQKDAAANFQATMQKISAAGMVPYKALSGLSNLIGGVGRGLEHVGQIGAIFGYRMALVAAPLVALGAAGAKASIDLETNVMRAATQLDNLKPDNVKKFVSETTTELRKLSTELPKAADDMADAVYYLVSTLTIDPEVARKMIVPVATFATAIKSSAHDAAVAVTPILNVYKEYATGADGVNKALEAMFETIRRGKGEASDIARQVGDFLAYGKQAGASLQQQLAIFAQLTRIAGSPSEASTQLSALFRGLTDDKTIAKLQEIGISVSTIVEGTGQWVAETGVLDEKQQKTLDGIMSKLQGPTGVTGLYGQLAQAQKELARNETDYAAKQSIANARARDDSREKVALLREQIKYYETMKSDLLGGVTTKWTGAREFRDVFDVLQDIMDFVGKGGDAEQKILQLQDIFPNVRALRGFLSVEGGMKDVRQWADEMVKSQGKVAEAAGLMGSTVESALTKAKNAVEGLGGQVFDTVIKGPLLTAIEYFQKLVKAIADAPPELKQMIVQFTLLAAAAGPASLVFGTFIMFLSQVVALTAALVSPLGIGAVAIAITFLGDAFKNAQSGIDKAGGGLKGLAGFLAAVAVELGLVKQTDALKFFEDMGMAIDAADFLTIRADAAAFVEEIRNVATGINDHIIQPLKDLAQFISENKEIIQGLGLAITTGVALAKAAEILAWLGNLRLALLGVGGAAAAASGAGGVGMLATALAALPTVVGITIAVAFAAGSVQTIQYALDSFAILTQSAKPGGNAMTMGAGSYNNLKYFMDQGREGTYPATPPSGGGGGGMPVLPDYTPEPWWVPGSGTEAEQAEYEAAGAATPAERKAMSLAARRAGGGTAAAKTGGTGGVLPGTRPSVAKTMTPQEAAPGIFARFAGAGWASAYAQQHGGRDPFSDYQSQGYSDPMGAALRDKAWGDQFFKEHGRAAEQGDWEAHWYQTYQKQEVPELDAEGKPTGKTKTVIGEKGGADAFTKMVEEAMKGLTDKKDELKSAYVEPAQALIDKKEEVTAAYLDPITAFQEAVTALIAWLKQQGIAPPAGGGGGGTAPAGSGSTGASGAKDYGGPVTTSGVYRLLKGEYVVSMPEQRDLRALMAGATQNNRGGDSYSIAINGANQDPKAIAAAVMAEMRWQQGRRSGKMVY